MLQIFHWNIILYIKNNEGENNMSRYEQHRSFLKSNFNEFKSIKTDKMKGIAQPPSVKSYGLSDNIINLPKSFFI